MQAQKLINTFPPLYSHLLPSFFQKQIPKEIYADCLNCPMCEPLKNKDLKSQNKKYFNSITKCCTFHPIIPNYLIGELLSDKSMKRKVGQKRVGDRIKDGKWVLPQGIFPEPQHFVLFDKNMPEGFGRNEKLLCPFFIKDQGLCSIWKSWNSYCSTYFCRFNFGKDGIKFWESVKEYLVFIENILTKYVMRELGFASDSILSFDMEYEINTLIRLNQNTKKKPFPKPDYPKLWGPWLNKKEEFYIKAYQLVKKLTQDKLKKLGGFQEKIYQAQITNTYQNMLNPQIPQKLKLNPKLSQENLGEDKVILAVYDPIVLPKFILNILKLFDGKKITPEIIEHAKKNLNATIHMDFIQHMYQHEILVSAK